MKPSNKNFCFNWIGRHLTSPEEVRLYAQDALLLNASAVINEAIEEAGLSRADVAERIGKTKSYVSQALSGSRNMTLKTMADLLWACEQEVARIQVQSLGEMQVPPESIDAWLETETLHLAIGASHAIVSAIKQLDLVIPTAEQIDEPVAA